MPSTPRTSRPGAGPGRSRRRSRPAARVDAPATPVVTETQDAAPPVRQNRGMGITRRALIMMAVLAFLLLSYAGSLRIYLDTERQNAENAQVIQRSQQRIDDLNAQLRRWDDPDFVRAQARERLGWVMPGETGYRVIGPDGRPVGTRIESTPTNAAPPPRAWYQRLWGALKTADTPVPAPVASAPPTASERPPITDGTRTPTPRTTPTKKPR